MPAVAVTAMGQAMTVAQVAAPALITTLQTVERARILGPVQAVLVAAEVEARVIRETAETAAAMAAMVVLVLVRAVEDRARPPALLVTGRCMPVEAEVEAGHTAEAAQVVLAAAHRGKATESRGWTVLQVLAAADLELAAMAAQAVLVAAERCLFAFTKIKEQQ